MNVVVEEIIDTTIPLTTEVLENGGAVEGQVMAEGSE